MQKIFFFEKKHTHKVFVCGSLGVSVWVSVWVRGSGCRVACGRVGVWVSGCACFFFFSKKIPVCLCVFNNVFFIWFFLLLFKS